MKTPPFRSYSSVIAPTVQIAVWDGDNGPSFTIRKSYKNEKGDWVESSSFFPVEAAAIQALMPKVLKCMEYLREERMKARAAARASGPAPSQEDPGPGEEDIPF